MICNQICPPYACLGRKVTEQGVLSAVVVVKYLRELGFKVKKTEMGQEGVTRRQLAGWLDRELGRG